MTAHDGRYVVSGEWHTIDFDVRRELFAQLLRRGIVRPARRQERGALLRHTQEQHRQLAGRVRRNARVTLQGDTPQQLG